MSYLCTVLRRRALLVAVALLAATTVTLPAATAVAAPAAPAGGKWAAVQRLTDDGGSRSADQPATGLARRLATGPQTAASPQLAQDDPTPPPGTQPSDLTLSGTSGVVTATATSTAPFVMFAVDGTPVAAPVPVATDTGTASTDLTTWGWANGTYTVTAADCSSSDPASCNPTDPTAAPLELGNLAPQITGPADGARITGGFTIIADAPGGGVGFDIDGTRRGFDGTAPYSFTYTGSALSPGQHTITLEACSSDESRCDGPESDPVTITSDSLHPRIVSVTPAVFSPNGDRFKDTSTLTYSLPDRETVTLSVTNAAGTVVVRGPRHVGSQARGTHAWTWNGKNNAGQIVRSARYRFTVSTHATVHEALVRGAVWHAVTVDTRPPSVSSLSAPASIYPVRDGYKDSATVKFALGERARTTLTVRNGSRRVVRTISSWHNPATVRLTWNGRDRAGRVVPAGRYTWRVSARDNVGNTRTTSWHGIVVSAKRLVARSVTITRNGDSFSSAGASDPNCAEASTSLSEYAHGVWLANSCFITGGIAAAFYRVSLPTAIVYSRFTVSVYGQTLFYPSSMTTGFGVHGAGRDFGIGGQWEINSGREGWYTIGSIKAANYVSATHRALIAPSVTDIDAPCDFDIKTVKVHLTYKVLR